MNTPSGTILLSDQQFPDTANPLFASSSADFEIDNALWAQPVFYDQQFHVHPDQLTEVPLPENGDVRDGGKTIVMHLRHDLHWSDGQPILASDFLYWWRLNQDSNTGATITSGYDQIASIDTPDTFTIILHMKRSSGPYLLYLPYAAPEHTWGRLRPIDLQNTPSVYQAPQVTSGPYKLGTVNETRYTLVPNTHYLSTTFHGPFASQLIYQSSSTVAAPGTTVQQQPSVMLGYTEDDLPKLAHMPASISVLEVPAASYEHLDFNNAKSLFHDVAVRKAIQLAINICDIIKTVLHTSDCARRATQVEPPPSLFYDSAIQPSIYNPDMARQLLSSVGWLPNSQGILTKGGQALSLRLVTTTDTPLRAAVARQIQHDLLQIGIQVQIAYYQLGTFFGGYTKGGVLATGAYDMALFTYENRPEPDDEYTVFHSSQIPDADHPDLGNYARVNDPLIDQALTQGRNTVIFADRVAAYHHFLERLADQVYIIPLYVEVTLIAVNKRVQNVLPNPNQSANTWNISDWWVAQ